MAFVQALTRIVLISTAAASLAACVPSERYNSEVYPARTYYRSDLAYQEPYREYPVAEESYGYGYQRENYRYRQGYDRQDYGRRYDRPGYDPAAGRQQSQFQPRPQSNPQPTAQNRPYPDRQQAGGRPQQQYMPANVPLLKNQSNQGMDR